MHVAIVGGSDAGIEAARRCLELDPRAITGAGATQRPSAVRWGLARTIVAAWMLTLPGAAIVAGIVSLLTDLALPSI